VQRRASTGSIRAVPSSQGPVILARGTGVRANTLNPLIELNLVQLSAVLTPRKKSMTSSASPETSTPEAAARQHPLTLVMTIRSRADYEALFELLNGIQSLPRDKNPIVAALDRIGTVHFARFVFLGTGELAVITTYDGDFEDYLNDFINVIGDIFDALLAHIADAPPLPVAENRRAFMDYVRSNDLRCLGPFYSAYPKLGVRTILAQAEDEPA
jgi:hypothetical protein